MGHRVTTLNVNTIEPAGNTLTIGVSGDSVVLADDVKSNTYKDAGGNTLFTSDGSGNLSSVNSGLGGPLVLISTQTASNSASISFTSGIDSTYKEYIFKFININPATDGATFQWQVNVTGQSGYNETVTSSSFTAYHEEDNSGAALGYQAAQDQAQGTSYEELAPGIGNGADESLVGELHLFNPSSTTYVKHFIARIRHYQLLNYNVDEFRGGYFNVTGAIDDVQFKMSSGNFDGKIKMYGMA